MIEPKSPEVQANRLYNDVLASVQENRVEGWKDFGGELKITNGRFGLSSKEFTPPMVARIFDELKEDKPKKHFTIGIHDDITNTSLDFSNRRLGF
ncbi:MAG: hypothetical protein U5K71_05310 [Gracilimonas sp.]|nr:hypothetical protein [Gracilimonas sp.]